MRLTLSLCESVYSCRDSFFFLDFMILGELVGYIAIVIVIILVKAEINFRRMVRYYRNLGYRQPKEQASRAYCIIVSFVQIASLIAVSILVWVLIAHWNDQIYINN